MQSKLPTPSTSNRDCATRLQSRDYVIPGDGKTVIASRLEVGDPSPLIVVTDWKDR